MVKDIKDHNEAVNLLLEKLLEYKILASFDEIAGVGHRIVQGGTLPDSVLLGEKELAYVSTNSKTTVDFPARPSLGTLELAPLPGLNEKLITGPAPTEPSVSPKDFPSDQLFGRITSEIFQEMADLERGNTF